MSDTIDKFMAENSKLMAENSKLAKEVGILETELKFSKNAKADKIRILETELKNATISAAQNLELAKEVGILETELKISKNANATISAVLQFRELLETFEYQFIAQGPDHLIRELLETFEYQFTAQAPDHLKPGGIDNKFYAKFQNRVARWKWILLNSTDPRAQMLSKKLSDFNAVDNFCVLVASLYINCPKLIHLPNTERLQPHEMSEKLMESGVATDDWSQSAVNLILFDIPKIPLLSQQING